MTLGELNALAPDEAATAFRACCGSTRWVQAMVVGRPFASVDALLFAADAAWAATGPGDWREAFAHHPRIGEQEAAVTREARERGWSAAEQGAVATADVAVRSELAAVNREYEARFGHVFLICATGKSAGELLATARARLANDPARELTIAAGEQHLITRLRLSKLLGTEEGSGR